MLGFAALILLSGGFLLGRYFHGMERETVQVLHVTPIPTLISTQAPTCIPTQIPTFTPIPTPIPTPTPETKKVLSKYAEFLSVNKDVAGYIQIPDTTIEYPVLYDSDSSYKYLKTDIEGKPSKYGSICLKYTNYTGKVEFARNTLIFGHHMKNGSMFAEVTKYKEKEFFEQHPYIYYDNLLEEAVWYVFSVYVVDADNETVETKFESDGAFVNYINLLKSKSAYPIDIELTSKDKIISLCTCSYEYSNGRTIVHAVKIEDGDKRFSKADLDALRR